jgi:D-threo-aldose 1-dehydrogenase
MSWRAKLAAAPLGFGTMAIGGQYPGVSEADAIATVHAAYAAGIRLFDTAPQYGCGLAEERLGAALKALPRDDVLVTTKVGKRIAPLGSGGQRQSALFFPHGHDQEMVFDYSYDGTMRCIEGSLQRLGLTQLDLVLIHDVIRHFHGDDGVHLRLAEALQGAIPALHRLRDEGVIKAIGTGLKDTDIAATFIEDADIDVVLLPGRITLLDQAGLTSGLADLCSKHGVALIAAAPFDSGILASGADAGGTSGYKPADTDVRARVKKIEVVCAQHGVALAAAALQFPRLHPAVAAVLCGMRHSGDVRQNSAWMAATVPNTLWPLLATAADIHLPRTETDHHGTMSN